MAKPKKFDFNIIVIGAGAAGLVTSYIAAALKAKVALIEKHQMGGDCLNTGCVPSKAIIRTAKMFSYAQRAQEFGLDNVTIDYDFKKIMERVHHVIKKIEPHDSVERYTKLGVDCIQGEAKILSPYEVQVNGKTLTTRAIVVATGARPLVPPIPGLNEVPFHTSDTIWSLTEQPKRLAVLGGGPIGAELAQSFARMGTAVSLIEMSPRMLPREDEDVALEIQNKFTKEGVEVLAGHKAMSFKKIGDDIEITLEHNGETLTKSYDQVLLAIGRKANVTGFGLEELGVKLRDNKTIDCDEFLRTNYKNIFVCGDVTGPYQFTHMAAHHAYYAAVNSLFRPFVGLVPPPFNKSLKVDYSVVPWATYTDPEIATVGHTETSAKAAGIAYEITKYGIDDLDRAIADSEDHGFVKVLTVPGKDKILGATIVGNHASDMIIEFIQAMKQGFGLNAILGTIHIYPTMSESNKFLAGQWKQKRKPEGALKILQSFFKWRRNA